MYGTGAAGAGVRGRTTVTDATLHNEDEIQRKDVRIGNRRIERRAGDAMPAKAVEAHRTLAPTTCRSSDTGTLC
ncbi:hypothetical protein [Azohydromonas australica]|uniref:hypothetical protein n=1 Tax=Azohydromonas australica TaxID=364039 RepID=UPI0035BEB757